LRLRPDRYAQGIGGGDVAMPLPSAVPEVPEPSKKTRYFGYDTEP
jgi:hypothetical protein